MNEGENSRAPITSGAPQNPEPTAFGNELHVPHGNEDTLSPTPEASAFDSLEEVSPSSASAEAPAAPITSASLDEPADSAPSNEPASPATGFSRPAAFSDTLIPSSAPSFFSDALASAPSPQPPKQSNKLKLIIIIALAALALIGAVVSAIVSSSSHQEARKKEEYRVLFLKFANYIISGKEDVTDALPEYDRTKQYYVRDVYEDPDASTKSAYFTKANELFSSFRDQLNAVAEKNPDDEKIKSQKAVVDNYASQLYVVGQRYTKGELSSNNLWKNYIESGKSSAQSSIDSFYRSYDEVGGMASSYANSQKAFYEQLLTLYDFYKKYDCVKDGQISDGCTSSFVDKDYDEAFFQLKKCETDSDDSFYEMSRRVYAGLWDIEEEVARQ